LYACVFYYPHFENVQGKIYKAKHFRRITIFLKVFYMGSEYYEHPAKYLSAKA